MDEKQSAIHKCATCSKECKSAQGPQGHLRLVHQSPGNRPIVQDKQLPLNDSAGSDADTPPPPAPEIAFENTPLAPRKRLQSRRVSAFNLCSILPVPATNAKQNKSTQPLVNDGESSEGRRGTLVLLNQKDSTSSLDSGMMDSEQPLDDSLNGGHDQPPGQNAIPYQGTWKIIDALKSSNSAVYKEYKKVLVSESRAAGKPFGGMFICDKANLFLEAQIEHLKTDGTELSRKHSNLSAELQEVVANQSENKRKMESAVKHLDILKRKKARGDHMRRMFEEDQLEQIPEDLLIEEALKAASG